MFIFFFTLKISPTMKKRLISPHHRITASPHHRITASPHHRIIGDCMLHFHDVRTSCFYVSTNGA